MSLVLRLTPAAERDLEDIWRYTEETWGRAQAERHVDGLWSVFQQLTRFPEMARLRKEFTPPVRVHATGRHVIVYLDTLEHIDIIRILGARQDWTGLLSALD